MARIRSIKPEFVQSETIGKLSRDARLLFVQLWTIADDDGRARASSRMLASLLYPYDDDARDLIEGWLVELERNGCIRRYVVNDTSYLDIPNWQKHQKIDRPSKSRLPEFVAGSPSPREESRGSDADLGSRTLDLGSRKERKEAFRSETTQEPSDPVDPSIEERGLFERGKQVLGKSAGGQITKLRQAKGGNVALARAVIEAASTKENPGEYVAAVIRGPPQGSPQALRDHKTQEWENARAALRESIARDRERQANGGSPVRILSEGSG